MTITTNEIKHVIRESDKFAQAINEGVVKVDEAVVKWKYLTAQAADLFQPESIPFRKVERFLQENSSITFWKSENTEYLNNGYAEYFLGLSKAVKIAQELL